MTPFSGNVHLHPAHAQHAHGAEPARLNPQPCGALLPPLIDYGWECYGIGLVVIARPGGRIAPVTLPARALEIIDPEPWWLDPVERFEGGDHVHLVIPRRPGPKFETDEMLYLGSSATPVKTLGPVVEDDPFCTRGPQGGGRE